MSLPNRNDELAREREQCAWRLKLLGLSLRKIAEQMQAEGLGPVSHVAVHRMLKRAERRALREMSRDIRRVKVRQVASLEAIFCQAMEGWRRSQEDAKLVREHVIEPTPPGTAGIDAAGNPLPAEPGKAGRKTTFLEVRGQAGDPRYLAEARGALADIRKVMGIDSPTEFVHEDRRVPPEFERAVKAAPTDVLIQARDALRRLAEGSGPASTN